MTWKLLTESAEFELIKGKVFGNLFGSHSNLTLQQNLLLQLKTVSLWEPSLQISSKSYTKENYNK